MPIAAECRITTIKKQSNENGKRKDIWVDIFISLSLSLAFPLSLFTLFHQIDCDHTRPCLVSNRFYLILKRSHGRPNAITCKAKADNVKQKQKRKYIAARKTKQKNNKSKQFLPIAFDLTKSHASSTRTNTTFTLLFYSKKKK